MNVLFIHAGHLTYEAKKATKFAERGVNEKGSFGKGLVCFMSFEEADEGNEEKVAGSLVHEIKGVASQLGEKSVVLYPYVHLLFGKKPGSPDGALKVMGLAEKELKKEGFSVGRSPFGFYKAFELDCLGHPLSELSRVIDGGERKESAALEAEKTLVSHWKILDAEGKLHGIEIEGGRVKGFDFKGNENLEKFAVYEMAKSRASEKEPPHVALMKQLELADYEGGSDPGNLRYPPKGKMVKALIEEYVTRKMQDYGAMEIEGPIMFDYEHPSLKKYLERFPARQYTIITPNKKVFLRFSACFGQFLMLHDAILSYRHMPVKLYEMAKYSFRVEQRGELTGLRRLRAFTMPDCHAFCADMKQANEQYRERFGLARGILEGCGLEMPKDTEMALRVVKDFWDKEGETLKEMAKEFGKPVLVEMWDTQFFYFVVKYEFNFVDNLGKASALSTDQIDIENAERYGLSYADANNQKQRPLILHLSPSGAIERIVYALLEKAYAEQKAGKNPMLPLWLSPTQVRICPVNDKIVKDAVKVSEELEKEGIRVDIDDRSESISKKIRQAEHDWVPYIVVLGEKELKSRKLAVRFREDGKVRELTNKDMVKEVVSKTQGMPFRPVPVPKLLTKRPIFIS